MHGYFEMLWDTAGVLARRIVGRHSKSRRALRAMARRKAAFVYAKRTRKLVPISFGQVAAMADGAPAVGSSTAPTEVLMGLSAFHRGSGGPPRKQAPAFGPQGEMPAPAGLRVIGGAHLVPRPEERN